MTETSTDEMGSNPTDNPHIATLMHSRLARRQVLGGGLAAAAAGFLGRDLLDQGAAAAADSPPAPAVCKGVPLGFRSLSPSTDDRVRVPDGYVAEVLVPWGTPLFRTSAAWAPDASNTAAEQAGQVGTNHDGMHYFPIANGTSSRRGLLVMNHEYVDANQIYTAAQGVAITDDAAGREKVAKALNAHGVTVVEIRRVRSGGWSHVQGSKLNRRVTGTTPMAFSGPVPTNHASLQAELGEPPAGTLNNCAHGYTPWGTYLACEENWNGYFGTDDAAWTATATESRYGVTKTGSGYNWHKAVPRFDLARNRREVNRFGWVVEIDPFDPTSTPTKRTALGRVKHEGATITEADGRVIVYTGDDENGEYLYKFVGDLPWQDEIDNGRSPLDHGTLYVARFAADGTGSWLPLVHDEGALTMANGWADQADVLLRTRQAADAVGATRLHRPEWVAVNRTNGDVFVTLTNGSGNSAPANSSRDPNPYGHILRFRETGVGASSTTLAWDVFLVAGDPAYPALGGTGIPAEQVLFGSPDGLWVDPDGLLWIQTDISNSSQNLASRGYDRIGNNQMLVANPATGELKRFLTGPRGCELTGVVTTPDQRTMFVNIQHPGESTTYWNTLNGAPSPANPRTVSNWPDFDPAGRPRSSTVVIRRTDGGKIGT